MESLGYGTQFILDGFNADITKLQADTVVTACLNDVAVLLEPAQNEPVSLRDSLGISAALCLNESHLSLHTYTSSVTLHLFSRHDVRLSEVSDLVTKHFGVRRTESFLSSHARTLPQDTEARKKVLAGERAYNLVRLEAVA
jgi:S-adenosylmethionine/arginine decarboxylase-like enzyme